MRTTCQQADGSLSTTRQYVQLAIGNMQLAKNTICLLIAYWLNTGIFRYASV
jgi:hypothetical protein